MNGKMMQSFQEEVNLISLVLNSWLSHFIQVLVELAGSLAFPGACFLLKTFTWLKGAYIVLYSLQILGTNMRAGGILKLAALVSVFFLAVFLAFQLLEINMDFNLGNVFGSMPVEEGPTRQERYKCGLSKPCPEGHFSFKMASGAASVVGPKICLEDNILMSGVKNNVGRGINIALVNGKTGDLIKTDYFDMWAGDVNTLITFLKTIEEGTVVMMATFDDSASKLNDESRKMIGELGSSSISTLGFRDNWIFVGGKGIKTKSPFEQHIKNNADTNKYEGWPEVLEMEGCIPQRQE